MSSPALKKLIVDLNYAISQGAPYTNRIRDPEMLIEALKDLNSMIGFAKAKDAVADQVAYLLMSMHSKSKENVMLNTVITGSPGVGKTTLGVKLAKIWYALGYLDNSQNEKDKKATDILRDILNNPESGYSDPAAALYFVGLLVIAILCFIGTCFYNLYKIAGMWIMFGILVMLVAIGLVAWYYYYQPKKRSIENVFEIERTEKKEKKEADANKALTPGQTKDEDLIKIVGRQDLVAGYVGQTAKLTNKVFRENLGKVVFVDESYSLINSEMFDDSFGLECLNTINKFISEHPNEIILVFAGYKDKMEPLFRAQPGLRRRFMWHFDVDPYNDRELFEIFKLQLKNMGWALANENYVKNVFVRERALFPNCGGDTERLGFYSRLEHSKDFISGKSKDEKVLTNTHVERGLQRLKDNSEKTSSKADSDKSEKPDLGSLAEMMSMMTNAGAHRGAKKGRSMNLSHAEQSVVG